MIRRRRRLDQLRDDAGLLLVEVLVSLMVMSVGIGGAFAVFPRSHSNAATAQNIQIASQLATDSIEQLRGTDWTTLKTGALRHAANYPSSPPVTDRVTFSGGTATKYTQPLPNGATGSAEPLVPTAAASSTQPLDYEQVSVDGRLFDVYRFASLRKESCPLISLSQLLGGLDVTSALSSISTLRTKLSSVSALVQTTIGKVNTQSTAVNTLLGSGSGSLAALTTVSNTTLTRLQGLSNLIVTLLGGTLNTTTKNGINTLLTNITSIQATLTTQATALSTTLSELNADTAKLSSMDTALSTLSTQLGSLNSAITAATASGLVSGGLIDLCQLPDDFQLPDLTKLSSLTSSLSGVGTLLDGYGINGSSTLATLGTSLDSLGTSVTNLSSSRSTLSGKLTTLGNDAQTLASSILQVTCGLLPICVTVQNDETGFNSTATLSYSGTFSVPTVPSSSTHAITAVDSTLSDNVTLLNTIAGQSATSTTSATGLQGLIDALLATPASGNTVRISVAVIPANAPDGVGPHKPVWVSSVVTNPSASIL